MAAAYASGSSSLLAEGVHSLTDIGNQALLWFGILRSRREPTAEYPYGYMKDKFIFSLISAVGIFCLGAGASIFQGVSAALQPHTVDNLFYGFIVLAVSAVLEAFSLWVAVKTLLQGAKACGMRFFEYVRSGRDPTTISVLMEDGGAVAGLCIAGVCTALVQWTGNTIWDAVGSILVGLLLGAIAIWLIQRNRGMLIGRAMDRAQTRSILQHLKKDPVVKAVYDVRSEELGPGVYRFKADIDFEGEKVVERHLVRYGRERLYERLCAASWTDDSRAMDLCLMEYGRELVSAIGAEVDRIEAEIQHLVPGVQYVDLETDRGRYLELRQEHSRVRPSPAVRPHVLHRMLKPPLLPQEGPRPPPVAAAGSGVVPVSDLDCQTDAAPGSAASGNGSAAIPSQPPANGSSCSASESVPSSDSSHPASTSGGGGTPPGV